MSILSLRTTLMALFGAVASAREIKLNVRDYHERKPTIT